MKFLFYKKRITKKAFSLIELSIVIVIISILVSGALSIFTNNIEKTKIKNTNDKINKIYEALKLYVVQNSKLPCPASILAIKATDSNYGQSVGGDGSCNASGSGTYISNGDDFLVYGMIPVKTLGLSLDMAEDEFGSKIAYVVDKRFTSLYPFNNLGSMLICENINSLSPDGVISSRVTYATQVIFTIISYGANKNGAFTINSTTQNSISSNNFEANNSISVIPSTTRANFFKDNKVFYKVQNSDSFDDIIFYKTRDDLISESGAFNLVSCTGETTSTDAGDGTARNYTWPAATYNQVVASTTTTPCPSGYKKNVANPTRRCGALGKWQDCCVDYCVGNNESSSCTGGAITTFTNAGVTRRVHTFLTDGTFRCPSDQNIDILVVGGGGGGTRQSYCTGGGGGGAVIYKTNLSITGLTNYSVIVGGGGGPYDYAASGYNGEDSKLRNSSTSTDIIVAIGGGAGGISGNETTYTTTLKGNDGGSGGGGGRGTGTSSGGAAVSTNISAGGTVYRNAGGNSGGSVVTCGAGGGGGAGGVGGNGQCGTTLEIGGNGGNGVQIDIAGVTPVPYYGSGGGGGAKTAFMFGRGGAYGQVGAGGNGGSKLISVNTDPGYQATSPVDGYGGGAGGACGGSAADGGSGVVIIAYTVTP